jgi:hypothetical protein
MTQVADAKISVVLSQGLGGTYFLNACGDSIVHIDAQGIAIRKSFAVIRFCARSFSDGNHGIVLASSTTAKRFNQLGEMIWPSPVVYLQDPSNAYFPLYVPDKNGGIISVFWTTRGGIYAQHTGRNGLVGIITHVKATVDKPVDFHLEQNFPNPFNPSTHIQYALPEDSYVILRIYNVLGQEVVTLVNEDQKAGYRSRTWNGRKPTDGGEAFVQVKKMLFVK